MAMIKIPSMLRQYAGNKSEFSTSRKSFSEILTELTNDHPLLKKYFFEEDGSLTKFISFYVNDKDIRYLRNLETEISDNDIITIIPAVAGG